jgi:NYN domain
LRAGFEIVDCPPVTSQGKTSTEIHMVLDIVDLLQHETRCDEFIVFSADADFTPVLRKIRRYGQGADDDVTLAAWLFNQVLFLCERQQKVPDHNEVARIRTRISGATVA